MTWTCLFYAADKSGITLNHARKIEVAFSKPSINTIIRIAEALEISVSELCNYTKQ
jgi:transcriptional regulator with XRE-family HTH domain